MEFNRKFWNDQHQLLRQALAKPAEQVTAMRLFLSQHAMVHTAAVSGSGEWSFEDEVWQGLSEADARLIPRGCDHSIAWTTWHSARIEDVTMNLLVAGGTQILVEDDWPGKMKTAARDTGNLMDPEGVARLSQAIDIPALRAYRQAVARRTRNLVAALQPDELKRKVDPARLQRIRDEGAVVEAAGDLLDYWGGLKISGLLLMPPTRHQFVHWNEALRIKQKLK
jgi:hypothetical protein